LGIYTYWRIGYMFTLIFYTALETRIGLTIWDFGAIISFIALMAIIVIYNQNELDNKTSREEIKKELRKLEAKICKEHDDKCKKLNDGTSKKHNSRPTV
jgi:uncharacterized membrane protein